MSEEMKQEASKNSFGEGIPEVEQETSETPESTPATKQDLEAKSDSDVSDEAKAPITLSPEQERVKNLVITVIRTVFDPEIPVNIYELGLIYAVDVSPENDVKVSFTLTSPNCPAAQDLPMEMERKIKALEGIGKVEMVLTWEPTWTPDMMTEAAKLQLNMF